MTSEEYDKTRKLPERKRATRNGKRSLDYFLKSCRDRTAVEHPEYLTRFDAEFNIKLMIAYFYFTKYICAKYAPENWAIFCATFNNSGVGAYTDNLLDDPELMPTVKLVRLNAMEFFSVMGSKTFGDTI